MPTAGKVSRFLEALLFLLLVTTACFSQPLPASVPSSAGTPLPGAGSYRNQRIGATEICGNNIDDDGNGLIDDKDFTCYYSSNTAGCAPSSVIWVGSARGLYWVDPQTGASQIIGSTQGFGDIAWGANGKLYGLAAGQNISEIDPYTGQLLSGVRLPAGYYTGNAMTGDGKGNLFMDVFYSAVGGPTQGYYIAKFTPATGQLAILFDLRGNNLSSGGDLTFLNGYLYLAAGGKRLVRINLGTGTHQVLTINSTVDFNGYGLMTLGDGYLYITDVNNLYQVDPITLQAGATPYYVFPYTWYDMPYGLSTYTEHCNAPPCNNPGIAVTIGSMPPYCANPGITLQASGTGITGGGVISWTLPDGTKNDGNTLLTTLSGAYTARYHNVLDDCGHDTSFTLTLIPSPLAALNRDSLLCPGAVLRLTPKDPAGITGWLWQDGATTPDYPVSSPGRYTLQVSNVCGVSKDSIMVYPAIVPLVNIGADAAICPGAGIQLYNDHAKQPWDTYTWSTASVTDTISVSIKAVYWLESQNVCGKTRDSVVLVIKDSCTCFPLYARVALPDDTEMCFFDSLLLKNAFHKDGFSYHWQNGSSEPKLMAYGPGNYWVDVSTLCGTVRDSIIIHPKKYGCEHSVRVPNAFSPGGNSNMLFRPMITGPPLSQYEFMVYNRWGQLVFHTTKRGEGWDGKINSSPQPPGIFVWSCVYRFGSQPVTMQKGTVLLVR